MRWQSLLVSLFIAAIAVSAQAKKKQELVTEFVKKTGASPFGKDNKYYSVLIESKVSDDYDDYLDEFTKAAKEFEGKVKFVYVDTNVEENWQMIEYLGLTAEDVPAVLFIELEKGLLKYKAPFDEVTKANIISFTQDCIDGKAESFVKGDEIPEDWDAKPVKHLVSKNFEEAVFDSKKTSFVFFYAPWCEACQRTMPEVEKLGKLYAKNKKVMIAKMDSTGNEVPRMPVLDVPTIALFLNGDPKPIYYTADERTVDAFSRFITEKMKGEAKEEEAVEEKEPKKSEAKKEGKKKAEEKKEAKTTEEKPKAKKSGKAKESKKDEL